MKTAIIAIVASSVLFTGCAVKDTDTPAEKVGKHIANSPLYVAGAISAAGLLLLSPIIAPVGAVIDAVQADGNETNTSDANISDINITDINATGIEDINTTITTGENDEKISLDTNNTIEFDGE